MTAGRPMSGNAADRVRAVLERRATMTGLDPEIIYAIDGIETALLTSDLWALVDFFDQWEND